jgi:RNA polymerase sigma-70 factor, ECF subfamily
MGGKEQIHMEESIVEHLILHDREALMDQLMDEYGESLLHLIYTYVGNTDVAKDLTQEVFIKCFQKLNQFNQKSSIKTWIWRIAINHCKDFLKSWHRKNIIISEEQAKNTSSQGSEIENQVIQKQEDEELALAVMSLPNPYREVIFLYYFEELSIKEISYLTKLNQNTIKSRLKRAKTLLKESLEG